MGMFTMPTLGADMEEGTLVEWRVRPGDEVSRGQIIALVDTDKATIDVEVFESGVVESLLVDEGATVPVGTPLARIVAVGAAPNAPASPEPAATSAAAPTGEPVSASTTPVPVPVPVPNHHVTSPLVRHLADELGVDLDRVIGTGHGGRVTRDDVEHAAQREPRHRASPRARRLAAERSIDLTGVTGSGPGGRTIARDVAATTSPAAATRRPTGPSGARAATARAMERSNREIPHYHLRSTVDLEPALSRLDQHNAGRTAAEQAIPAAVLLTAVAAAARQVPEVNGSWVDDELVASATVDLGTVVSLRGGGLLTPTIQDADQLTLDRLMERLRELVDRSRSGGLRASDLAPASLTVTNLGDRGADVVHGVIHPPQVALVGFGRIARRPHVVDGHVEARRTVVVSLAADHRASDGRIGSRFLHLVEQHLADPDRLPFDVTPGDPT